MAWLWTVRQFFCRHKHMQRVTVHGVRYFRCGCGYQVEQINRVAGPALQTPPARLRGVPGPSAEAVPPVADGGSADRGSAGVGGGNGP